MSSIVRVGVIGLGNMGASHARLLLHQKVPDAMLIAVCDGHADRRTPFAGIAGFDDSHALIKSGLVDAVIIATPHFSHTSIGIDALKAGLHVLVEKPISVHKADCLKLLAAHRRKTQVFAAMFNQRTDPAYRMLRGEFAVRMIFVALGYAVCALYVSPAIMLALFMVELGGEFVSN